MPQLSVAVAPALWFLLPPRRRRAITVVAAAASDTVGHVVRSLGVPLTEVGGMTAAGRPVTSGRRIGTLPEGAELAVTVRPRPQPTRREPPRFLLDVHLGALARRLRLLGLDTAYETEADDADLAERSVSEQRVLLTRDRALLFRAVIVEGALVRGEHVDEQTHDVLDRFLPPLAPFTRCLRCNGVLERVAVDAVAGQLEPGTLRSYTAFSRCTVCGRAYWRGAHGSRLEQQVAAGQAALARARRRHPVGAASAHRSVVSP